MKSLRQSRSNLPSISSLQAFEAVSRRLSFTRASEELSLTQTAISHQVRKLEAVLGTQLFVRDKNGVRLTRAGREYLETVRTALTLLSAAGERAIESRRLNQLTVISLPAFAMKCLLPALPEFRRAHPDIPLRLDTVVTPDTVESYKYDVAIRYGNGDWPDLNCQRIAEEEVFPVCSPAIAAGSPALASPTDLAHHVMIKTSSLALRDEWPAWLDAAGVNNLRFADAITCDLVFSSIQAAVDGLGIVMGRTLLVDRDLHSGSLIEPFSIRARTPFAYYVTSPPEKACLPQVRLFREWLVGRFCKAARPPDP